MAELTHRQFDRELILESALESWLWLSIIEPNEENQLESEEAFDVWADRNDAEIDRKALERWEEDIETFLNQAHDLLLELQESGLPICDIGHDLALTRNQHGTGFWAREYPDHIADGLEEVARSLPELYPVEYREYGRWFITTE